MKTKVMMAVLAIGMFASSCGPSAEEKKALEAKTQEVKELGNQLNEIEGEIKALEEAESEIDAAMTELDEI